MSKSWHDWTLENLQRNCNPEGIARILLDAKLPIPQIRGMMGERFPEHLVRPAAQRAVALFPTPGAISRKRESITRIRRALRNLRTTSNEIERRPALSGTQFLDEYYSANRPVILTDLMKNWKACSKWTPEYLKEVCGGEMVEIMAAREQNPLYEIDDAPHRKNVAFSEFVDLVTNSEETNDYYLTARNNFFARPGVRALLGDMEPFEEYLELDDTGNGMYLWYGPRGTVTPMHHDLMNIFMAQVRGSKHIKLVSPDDLDLVYNHHAVYSLVDAGKPDYLQFPSFKDARVFELQLGPTEVLFLPVGWWHYVKALDTSITVTFNNFRFHNQFDWANLEFRPSS